MSHRKIYLIYLNMYYRTNIYYTENIFFSISCPQKSTDHTHEVDSTTHSWVVAQV